MRMGWWLLACVGLVFVGCGDGEDTAEKGGSEKPPEEESPSKKGDPSPEENPAPAGSGEELHGFWMMDESAVDLLIAEMKKEEGELEKALGLERMFASMIKRVTIEIGDGKMTSHFGGRSEVKTYKTLSAKDGVYVIEIDGKSQTLKLQDDKLILHDEEAPVPMPLRRLSDQEWATRKAENEKAKERSLAGPGEGSDPEQRIMWMMNAEVEVVAAKLEKEPEWAKLLGNRKRTTLHYAAKFNKPELVSLFLKHGVDPKALSEGGESALHEAVGALGDSPSKEMITELIEAGCDLNLRDQFGRTPVAHVRDAAVAEFLFERGVDPKSEGAKDCLQRAAQRGNKELIQVFFKRGVGINDPVDDSEDTLLHRAVALREKDMINWLIEQGADPQKGNRNGATPLLYTVDHADDTIMKLLLSQGAKPDGTGKKGSTPLSYAAHRGKLEAVKALLAAGADPNAPSLSREGKPESTPLVQAVVSAKPEIIKVLLDAGAKTDVVVQNGMTPADLAQNSDNPVLWKLLPLEGEGERPTEKKNADGLVEVKVVFGGEVSEVEGIRWDTTQGKPVPYFYKRPKSILAEVVLPDGKTVKVPSHVTFRMDQREGEVRYLLFQPLEKPVDFAEAVKQLEHWVGEMGVSEGEGVAERLTELKALTPEKAAEKHNHMLRAKRADETSVDLTLSKSRKNGGVEWLLQWGLRK